MKRWVKGVGYAAVGLLGVVLVAVAGVYGFSEADDRNAGHAGREPLGTTVGHFT